MALFITISKRRRGRLVDAGNEPGRNYTGSRCSAAERNAFTDLSTGSFFRTAVTPSEAGGTCSDGSATYALPIPVKAAATAANFTFSDRAATRHRQDHLRPQNLTGSDGTPRRPSTPPGSQHRGWRRCTGGAEEQHYSRADLRMNAKRGSSRFNSCDELLMSLSPPTANTASWSAGDLVERLASLHPR